MIIDEMGIERHTSSRERLENLYREFANFVADCTPEEYREKRAEIVAIKTMIHQRMQQTK